jgi:hypothetical protein
MKCDTCKHLKLDTSLIDGDCHRYPPTNGVFRPVKATDWCGEWKTTKGKAVKATRFVKPTVADLKEYAASIRFDLDCQGFLDFYDSKAWKIGKNPMKDWQAAVRTWHKKEGKAVSSKDCCDCGAAWKEGFKFTGLGKAIKYRCPECAKKRYD